MRSFGPLSPIQRLPNDLLRDILDQIEPDIDKPVPVDRRQFLSVESFDRPPEPSRGSAKDIRAFRCTCRRFADVGAPLLFTRVAARFSTKGLQKLEQLSGWPHLACHVKKFTYLVPYFYKDGGVRVSVAGTGPALGLHVLRQKAAEQRKIVESKYDVRVLKRAIASFTSLQLVQLLRVTDREDDAFLAFLQTHEDLRPFLDLEWAPACSHGSQTIGEALLASNVPWSRFSSPMLSPQSAEFLASHKPRSMSTLAERLTCLTLHFDDGNDLDQKMSDLSNLFRTVFTTAKQMQAVHVGFPSHRPLSLPLEMVFHNVTWDRLTAFGVQGWRLDAHEVIDMALRHRDRLKGLRLRDVLLKDGSTWKEVLAAIRDGLHQLEWVSLRRIGYARHFDDFWLGAGAEVPDDPPPGESNSESEDSDDSEDDYDGIPGPSSVQTDGNTTLHHQAANEQDSSDDYASDSESEHGAAANEMEFPPLSSPITPASAPWCNCNGSRLESEDDLGDDGSPISNTKRKAWEKWVVRRCPEHSDK